MAVVKRVISFTDLDGNPKTEEWHFNLGITDYLETDLAHEEDTESYLKDIAKDHDTRKMLVTWKDLLFRSVAKRVGNQLVKNEEIVNEFRYSGAYEAFFLSLLGEEDGGHSFFDKILPDEIREKSRQAAERVFTNEELLAMSDSEFYAAAGTKEIQNMDKRFLQIAFQRKNNAA